MTKYQVSCFFETNPKVKVTQCICFTW